MSWEQSEASQCAEDFLMEYLGIDEAQLKKNAIRTELEERKLKFTVFAAHNSNIEFSDGKRFVLELLEQRRGDDWGSDYYGYTEAGKQYVRDIIHYGYEVDGEERMKVNKVICQARQW